MGIFKERRVSVSDCVIKVCDKEGARKSTKTCIGESNILEH